MGAAASSQNPRKKKPKNLKRLVGACGTVCLQEAHERSEHLLHLDLKLEPAGQVKIGTFTSNNVNSGGSIILQPGVAAKHRVLFLGRDHYVVIQQGDRRCVVVNEHFRPEFSLVELR